MAEWSAVEKRAEEELVFAKSTADNGAKRIEQFYPELHSSFGANSFTNTIGSSLIPDLLTSHGVVVDLYDWDSPESLIDVYGVDLECLLALRDENLIKLCANLPPERYKDSFWLFGLLADSRTIFRSIRTPAFISAIDPDLTRRTSERETNLKRYFDSVPPAEIERICQAVWAAHPPKDASSLASVLAVWLERLASFEPEIAAEVSDGFERHLIDRMPKLMRLQHQIVSPHTSALGGKMKIDRSRWAALFGEEGIDAAILKGHVALRKLNEYFSEVQLKLDERDLTNKQEWNNIRSADRKKIIDHLADSREKADLLAVEETLRAGLVAGGDLDPSRKSIIAYIEKLEGEEETLRGIGAGLGLAVSVAFPYLEQALLAGFDIAKGCFTTKQLLGDRIQRVTERVIEKVRVVR